MFPTDLVSGMLDQVSRLMGQRRSMCGIEASGCQAPCAPFGAILMLWPAVYKLEHQGIVGF